MLPRHTRCNLSRLHCNGHRLLLSSYLFRIGRIENFSCSACGHLSQDTTHLILHCSPKDSLRRSLFSDSLSLYNLWSRPWGVSKLLGLYILPPFPHPSKEVGQQQLTLCASKHHHCSLSGTGSGDEKDGCCRTRQAFDQNCEGRADVSSDGQEDCLGAPAILMTL